jgi:hypothetical protein
MLLVWLALAQDVDVLRQDLAALEKRVTVLKAQIEALPTDSALALTKIDELKKAAEELGTLRDRLREATPEKERVKIKDVRLQESFYALEARAPALAEGESLYLRVALENLRSQEGRLSFSFDIRVLNPDGSVKHEKKDAQRAEVEDQYGAGAFRTTIMIGNIRGVLGKVKLELTARDLLSGLRDAWSTDLDFRKAEFGLYNLYWSADEGGDHEIPGTFRLSGQRFAQFKILGFTAEAGRVHVRDGFQILDETKKVLYTFEGRKEGRRGNAPDNWIIQANRKVNAIQPGRYYARLIMEDLLSGKRAERDLPFRVLGDGGAEY